MKGVRYTIFNDSYYKSYDQICDQVTRGAVVSAVNLDLIWTPLQQALSATAKEQP